MMTKVKMNLISHITKQLRIIADDLGLELYPVTKLSKGELWVVFFNPDSHKARKMEIKLDEFVDTEETYDMIRGFLVREGLSNGLGYKYDTTIMSRYITTHNPYLDVSELFPLNMKFGLKEKEKGMNLPKIEKVIFNDPATIIKWRDGSKTVVKAENEPFDPEKGLAMAITKKALGNQGNYYEVFKKWIPEENTKIK